MKGGGLSKGTYYTCQIVSNSAGGFAGGVGDAPQALTKLYNCLIANNVAEVGYATAAGGGGVGCMGAMTLYNCTIVSNRTAGTNGGGICVSGDATYGFGLGTGTFVNCIIYSNSAAGGTNDNYYNDGRGGIATFTNCCTTPLPAVGANNIADPPVFVNFTNGNFRLAEGSPCINTGTNQAWMAGKADLDGNHRIDAYYGTVDMGCYEYFFRGTIIRFR